MSTTIKTNKNTNKNTNTTNIEYSVQFFNTLLNEWVNVPNSVKNDFESAKVVGDDVLKKYPDVEIRFVEKNYFDSETFHIPINENKSSRKIKIPINKIDLISPTSFDWLKVEEPVVDIHVITRELGEELLSRNMMNRTMPKNRIKILAETFTEDYQFTGDTIKVSSEGVLIDGQHRLTALQNLGWPSVRMVIVRGLEPKVKLYIDQGKKRNIVDSLQIHMDDKIKTRLSHIANYIAYHENGWGANGRKSLNIPNQKRIIMENYEQAETLLSNFLECGKNIKFFANSFYAAFLVIAKQTGKMSKVVEFMKQVAKGTNLTEKCPAYHLRNLVLNKAYDSTSELHKDRFIKTIIATRAYLNGETMNVLRRKELYMENI